jgi:hypothetical protein
MAFQHALIWDSEFLIQLFATDVPERLDELEHNRP